MAKVTYEAELETADGLYHTSDWISAEAPGRVHGI